MRFPTQKQRPRKAELASFPAPTGGLVSNRNLAEARAPNLPPGAAVLENCFPTASGVRVRRGSVRFASVDEDEPVRKLFAWDAGSVRHLFAATDGGIWDITTVADADVWLGTADHAATDGNWSTAQMTTAGGTFVVGVNGTDAAFIYDGTSFGATSITFPGGSGLTTADLVHVWVFKEHLWFIERDSLNAWYLPVGAIAGELTKFPLGGVFPRGGALLWGNSWSTHSADLAEQCVFVTTEGDVIAYQGTLPGSSSTWAQVGSYRIGRPLGRDAWIRAGGDLVIATTVGFVSLAEASARDYAALGQNAVSHSIEDDWAQTIAERGDTGWQCAIWAEGQMVVVAPPTPPGRMPMLLVANSMSGAWCRFTAWNVTAPLAFNGALMFGSADGRVRRGWVTGADEGQTYVGRCLPLFDSLGAPGSRKIAKAARATLRSAAPLREHVSAHFGFHTEFPPAPSPQPVSGESLWNAGLWDQAVWDADRSTYYSAVWRSVGGSGGDVSVGVQVSSGSLAPVDAELVRIDLLYETADLMT
jgi:hypothetical protein